jgi:hypothetical protein
MLDVMPALWMLSGQTSHNQYESGLNQVKVWFPRGLECGCQRGEDSEIHGRSWYEGGNNGISWRSRSSHI